MAVVKVPKRRPKQQKVRIWPQTLLEWVITLAIAAACLAIWAQTVEPVRRALTNPWFFCMVTALILEFLIIKSGDRSKVYQREARQLQQAQDRWNLSRGRALKALEEAEESLADSRGKAKQQAVEALERAKKALKSRG
ncbi:hypothetical protein JXA32_02295 [Candidatus Sumerlaeota bacterium]|nr:hypothetical protein [Candidatus Sumerlaeota bacterium]